jgi:glutathione S-transferase
MWGAFWHLIRTPAEKRSAETIEASRAKSEKLAGILDAHLADRRNLTGDEFTAADIVVGCAAHRWLNLPVERTRRPNLERWYADLKARPASRQVTHQQLA